MSCMGNAHGLGNFEYGGHTVVDMANQKVFRGVAWSWTRRFSIGASGVYNICIDPTGIDPGKTSIVLPTSFIAFGAGPINVDLYFGTAYSGGTAWPGANRDNRITTTPKTVVYGGAAVTTPGVKTPFEFMIPSDGVPATASLGGQAKDDLIFIARNDGIYRWELTNTEANVASCVFAMTLFEVTPGVNNG